MSQEPNRGPGPPAFAIRDVYNLKPARFAVAKAAVEQMFQDVKDGTLPPDDPNVLGTLCKYVVRRHHNACKQYVRKIAP